MSQYREATLEHIAGVTDQLMIDLVCPPLHLPTRKFLLIRHPYPCRFRVLSYRRLPMCMSSNHEKNSLHRHLLIMSFLNSIMIAIVLQTIRLSNSKRRRGNQIVVTSEEFPMKFSSYISVESPQQNKAYPEGVLIMEDPNDTTVTDDDKWHKDTLSIHISQSDALSEIPVDERRPSVV